MKRVKAGAISLDAAMEIADRTVERMKKTKAEYMASHVVSVNREVETVLNGALMNLLKFSFQKEIGGAV